MLGVAVEGEGARLPLAPLVEPAATTPEGERLAFAGPSFGSFGEGARQFLRVSPAAAARIDARLLDLEALRARGALESGETRVLVRLQPGASASLPLAEPLPFARFGLVAGSVRLDALEALATLPAVVRVFPEETRELYLAETVPLIRADAVHARADAQGRPVVGTGVTIAIIDTGVDHTHPDLGGCFGAGCKVVGGYDHIDDDPAPQDGHGHGTHVAATAAGARGVAPGASILAYRVCHTWGCPDTAILAAIEDATLAGADIISMSLGGPGTTDGPLATAVDWATSQGVVVVSAAGNSGADEQTVGEPAAALSGLAVGATNKWDGLASFSSRGPVVDSTGAIVGIKPDLVAPGVGVVAAVPTGSCPMCDPSGERAASGTSMAAPHVSGAAALLLQARPDWSPAEVKGALLAQTADIGLDARAQGDGRLDALAALDAEVAIDGGVLWAGLVPRDVDPFVASLAVRVHNLRDAPVVVELAAEGTGHAASVEPPSVELPPRGSATVTLHLTEPLASLPRGYVGGVVAAGGATARYEFLRFEGIEIVTDAPAYFVLLYRNERFHDFVAYPGAHRTILAPEGTYDVFAELDRCPDADACWETALLVRENVEHVDETRIELRRADAEHRVTHEPLVEGAPVPEEAWYGCPPQAITDPCWNDARDMFVLEGSDSGVRWEMRGPVARRFSDASPRFVYGGYSALRAGGDMYHFGNGTRGVDRDLRFVADEFQEHGLVYNLPPGWSGGRRWEFCSHPAAFPWSVQGRLFVDGEREGVHVSWPWLPPVRMNFSWGPPTMDVVPCGANWYLVETGDWDCHEPLGCFYLGQSLNIQPVPGGLLQNEDDWLWWDPYDDRYSVTHGDVLIFDGAPYLLSMYGLRYDGTNAVGVGGRPWMGGSFSAGSGSMLWKWQRIDNRAFLDVSVDGVQVVSDEPLLHVFYYYPFEGSGNVTATARWDGGFIDGAWSNVTYEGSWHTDLPPRWVGQPQIGWARVSGDTWYGTNFSSGSQRVLRFKVVEPEGDAVRSIQAIVRNGAAEACFAEGAAAGACAPFHDPRPPADALQPLRQLLGLEEEFVPEADVRTAVLPDLGDGEYDVEIVVETEMGQRARLLQEPAFLVGRAPPRPPPPADCPLRLPIVGRCVEG